MKRVNIKQILADPEKRKRLCVDTIIATQAREGITTSREQAEAAYEKAKKDRSGGDFSPPAPRDFTENIASCDR